MKKYIQVGQTLYKRVPLPRSREEIKDTILFNINDWSRDLDNQSPYWGITSEFESQAKVVLDGENWFENFEAVCEIFGLKSEMFILF